MLDLLQLKTIKLSDTLWLAHECCGKVVKGSYSTIVNAFNNVYEQTHKPSLVSAIYLYDFALSQKAKLSRSLQAEKIDLTAIAPLVDAILSTLNDIILPVAKWILQLLDTKNDLEAATGIKITTESITFFQD